MRAANKVPALSKREQVHMYVVTIKASRFPSAVMGAEAEGEAEAES